MSVPNVSNVGFWETAVDQFSVNGVDLGLTGRTAIMDTVRWRFLSDVAYALISYPSQSYYQGTTLIIAPAADAAAVHAAIPGSKPDKQGGFTIPCTTSASFALTVGGQTFAIDPRDLTFLPVDPANLTGDCVSGISSGTVGAATEWLV